MLRSLFIPVSLSLIGSLCFQLVHSLGALADIPAFQTQLGFGTSCPLWDPTNNYAFTKDVPDLNLGTTTISFTLSTDEKGKVSGLGSWRMIFNDPDDGPIEWNLTDSKVKGKIKSPSGTTSFSLKSLMKAPCGAPCSKGLKVVGTFKFQGEVDGTGTAHGTLALSLKFKTTVSGIPIKKGIFKEKAPFAFPLAQGPGNDGSWPLALDITSADGRSLTGTAEAQLSNGRIIDNLAGSGKYNAGNDTSKLSLKGLGGAKIKLKDLTADGNTQTLVGGTLKYKILGQKRETSLTSSCFP